LLRLIALPVMSMMPRKALTNDPMLKVAVRPLAPKGRVNQMYAASIRVFAVPHSTVRTCRILPEAQQIRLRRKREALSGGFGQRPHNPTPIIKSDDRRMKSHGKRTWTRVLFSFRMQGPMRQSNRVPRALSIVIRGGCATRRNASSLRETLTPESKANTRFAPCAQEWARLPRCNPFQSLSSSFPI
jgi:hypothetical protein